MESFFKLNHTLLLNYLITKHVKGHVDMAMIFGFYHGRGYSINCILWDVVMRG